MGDRKTGEFNTARKVRQFAEWQKLTVQIGSGRHQPRYLGRYQPIFKEPRGSAGSAWQIVELVGSRLYVVIQRSTYPFISI